MTTESHQFGLSAVKLSLILLACFAIYLPTTGNGFAMDDEYIVQEMVPGGVVNRMVAEWQGLGAYFTTPYWSVAANPDQLYRPVTILSYALVSQQLQSLVGTATAAQHWVNVLLNVWAVYLVILLLRVLRVQPGVAAVAALLFGMNAIHSEVVANVIGRAEILAFCFGASASLTFLRSMNGDLISRIGFLCLAAFLLFLGFCSKESGLAWVGFLPVLILAHVWREEPSTGVQPILRTWLPSLLPVLLVACAAFFCLRVVALAEIGEDHYVDYVANPLFHASWDQRVMTAVMLWGYGLWKVIFPLYLSSDYGAEVFSLVTTPTNGAFMLASLVLVSLLVVGLRKPRQQPLLFAAIACFFGFSFITSNVAFATGVSFAERLFYTPSLALCLAYAWSWDALEPKWRRLLFWGAILWILVGAAKIWDRNDDWKDTVTLALSDSEQEPLSVRLAMIAAQRLGSEGSQDPSKLEAARLKLLAVNQVQSQIPRVSQALGAISLRKGQLARNPDLRKKHFTEAEQYFSEGINAIYFDEQTQGPDLRADLAQALIGLGQPLRAMEQLGQSLDVRPGDMQRLRTFFNLNIVPWPTEVLSKYLQQAESYFPGDPAWERPKAILAVETGQLGVAERHFALAMQADPADWETRIAYARCLHANSKRQEAIRELGLVIGATNTPERVREEMKRLRESWR
ncbi:MAG: tetratricopeptide repeat protein [Planctomycetota bacterium]|jgi:tetratricopeptide (TPR) repeat protein